MLRVGGQLSRAMSEENKNPIILAKDEYVSRLIMEHVHRHAKDKARNHVFSKLRERYWITNAATRNILSKFVFCRKFKGKIWYQKWPIFLKKE